MSDFPKDESRIPGGLAGGKASAERPEEDRKASSRKAAETRHKDQVGPAIPAAAGQTQSYDAELRGSTLAVEREGETGAVMDQMRQGEREAAKIEDYKDKQDPDYTPEREG